MDLEHIFHNDAATSDSLDRSVVIVNPFVFFLLGVLSDQFGNDEIISTDIIKSDYSQTTG